MFGAYFSEAIVGGAIDTGANVAGAIVGVANVASPEHLSPEQLSAEHMSWNPLNQYFEIDGTGVYKRFSNHQFIQIFYWF